MFIAQIKQRLRANVVKNGIVKKIRFGPVEVPYHRNRKLNIIIPLPPTIRELENNVDKLKLQHYLIKDELSDEKKLKILSEIYEQKLHKVPNLTEPQTFTEKINWLKIHYCDPLITVCCDKFAVKEYVKNELKKELCVKTIKSWNSTGEIDFEGLPESFVLKVNWSSGYNIFVEKKSALSKHEKKLILKQLEIWTRPCSNSYYDSFNWGYKDVEPVIYAEEMLDKEYTHCEYKVFCFDGKASFVLVEISPNELNPQRICVDKKGNVLPFSFGEQNHAFDVKIPECFSDFLEVAEKLAAPFPFVRIDFLANNEIYLLGEMTFYSGGGFSHVSPDEWDAKLGNLIHCSRKSDKA